jgi:phage terminase large subunit-like protein
MNLQEVITLQNQGLLTQAMLNALPIADKRALAQEAVLLKAQLRQEDQIQFYVPVSDRAKEIHYSRARDRVVIGGNRSSKSDTALSYLTTCMTGIVPHSIPNFPMDQIHCPGRYRLVCESLTNTWAPVIRPKLQWDHWNGKDPVGGPRGHWGWIPKRFLIKGKWDESWSSAERILTLTCGCTLQVMSYDQDVQDFSGSSMHGIIMDEGPPHDIYNENKMRTMDTGGWILIPFTPPAEETTSWKAAWIHDELYEKGLPGPAKDPQIDVFELWTHENRILDKKDIDETIKGLTPAQIETRTKGAFLHLGGRIYPVYTDIARQWCFTCNDIAFVQSGVCSTCQNKTIGDFCHLIEPFDFAYAYPCVFLLDPHPRKAVMMSWVVIDAYDDIFQIAEMSLDKEPADIRDKVLEFERDMRLNIKARLIDPKMAGQAAHNAGQREISVRDVYDAVGLRCKIADSSFDVGMKRIRELLKPDKRTQVPRLHVFNTCHVTNKQMKTYSWDEHATAAAATKKDAKDTPITKNDDFPTLLKYFVNENYTYSGLMMSGQSISVTKTARRGAYG